MSTKPTIQPPTFSKTEVLRRSFQFFNGNENRFSFAWRRYAAVGAGGITNWQLRNPTNNLVAVIEKLFFYVSVGGSVTLLFGPQSADLTSQLATTRLDSRIGNSPSGLIASSQNGGVTIPSTMSSIGTLSNILANFNVEYIPHVDCEIPLLPGDALLFSYAGGGNLQVVSFYRERLLEEVEKSGNYGKML